MIQGEYVKLVTESFTVYGEMKSQIDCKLVGIAIQAEASLEWKNGDFFTTFKEKGNICQLSNFDTNSLRELPKSELITKSYNVGDYKTTIDLTTQYIVRYYDKVSMLRMRSKALVSMGKYTEGLKDLRDLHDQRGSYVECDLIREGSTAEKSSRISKQRYFTSLFNKYCTTNKAVSPSQVQIKGAISRIKQKIFQSNTNVTSYSHQETPHFFGALSDNVLFKKHAIKSDSLSVQMRLDITGRYYLDIVESGISRSIPLREVNDFNKEVFGESLGFSENEDLVKEGRARVISSIKLINDDKFLKIEVGYWEGFSTQIIDLKTGLSAVTIRSYSDCDSNNNILICQYSGVAIGEKMGVSVSTIQGANSNSRSSTLYITNVRDPFGFDDVFEYTEQHFLDGKYLYLLLKNNTIDIYDISSSNVIQFVRNIPTDIQVR